MTLQSQTYELGHNPRLTLRSCAADLRISGSESDQVEVQYLEGSKNVLVQQEDNVLEITSSTSLTVGVPANTAVALEGCAGDAYVSNVKEFVVKGHRGDLSLQQVHQIEIAAVYGDVGVGGSASLQVTTLNGDLKVRSVSEKVSLTGIRGDVSTRDTAGQVNLRGITGDVLIRDPGSFVEARDLNGSIKFCGDPQDGQFGLQANGSIKVYLKPTSNVHLELEAPLGRIRSDLELKDVQQAAHSLVGDLGTGAARLTAVAASGDIRLSQDRGADKLASQLAKAEARAEREARRAERRAERLERKAERLEQRAQKRAARLRRWQVKWGQSQAGKGAENLEQERLAVLRMLAENKIDAEQAEALLDALEG